MQSFGAQQVQAVQAAVQSLVGLNKEERCKVTYRLSPLCSAPAHPSSNPSLPDGVFMPIERGLVVEAWWQRTRRTLVEKVVLFDR